MIGPARVWITRAQPGADRTAARLTTLGHTPVVQPLLAVQTIAQPAPDLSDVGALAFTSGNGVAAFAALTSDRRLPVFTVGDATAEAARAAGFAQVNSARGAVAELGRLVGSARPEGVVLVPGAREPAGDPAPFAPGLTFRALPVYQARETGAALPDPPADAVLLHSPRAGRALAALWPRLAPAPAIVAISANAAAPLRPLSRCFVARAPNEDALLTALERALGKGAADV